MTRSEAIEKIAEAFNEIFDDYYEGYEEFDMCAKQLQLDARYFWGMIDEWEPDPPESSAREPWE